MLSDVVVMHLHALEYGRVSVAQAPEGFLAVANGSVETLHPDRIIRTSSNEGGVALDPFCGCATACSAAEKLDRKWVGVGTSPKAFDLSSMRLKREAGLDKFAKGAGALIHRTDVPTRKGRRSPDIKDKLYGTNWRQHPIPAASNLGDLRRAARPVTRDSRCGGAGQITPFTAAHSR